MKKNLPPYYLINTLIAGKRTFHRSMAWIVHLAGTTAQLRAHEGCFIGV